MRRVDGRMRRRANGRLTATALVEFVRCFVRRKTSCHGQNTKMTPKTDGDKHESHDNLSQQMLAQRKGNKMPTF